MTDLFQVASELDEAVRNGADVMATSAKSRLLDIAEVLGVLQQDPDAWFEGGADDDLKAKVEALIAERIAARAAKDFAAADRIRDELTALNIVVMDGPTGATWRLKD
jgi:cysteinyl-tRNA synthetase